MKRLLGLALTLAMLMTLVAAPVLANGSFVDDDTSVHEADIEVIAAEGITRGCNPPENDRFCPDDPVTRGQMAAFVGRTLGLTGSPAHTFTDVSGHVFETDIAILAEAGITRGCNPPANDQFCPDGHVTRGQMAAFLARAAGLTGNPTHEFTDVDGSVFEADIARLADAGITRGCNPPTNDQFCPDAPVTRGQMASFLVRSIDHMAPTWTVLPYDAVVDGQGAADLLETWWRGVVESPYEDTWWADITRCDNGLSTDSVYFAPDWIDPGDAIVDCTMGEGQVLFLSSSSLLCSDAIPEDGTPDECIAYWWDDPEVEFEWSTASIDGIDLGPWEEHLYDTEQFQIDVPADNVFGADPGTYNAKIRGIVYLVDGLEPGEYEIVLAGSFADGFVGSVTINLTVGLTFGT